mgnify:CR=1 FL=1
MSILGKTKNDVLPPTQEHVLVQTVRDQCILLKSCDMSAVLEVEGRDLTRLSNNERLDLLAQYENWLTTLRFPYQFIIARKTQRLEEYFDFVEQSAKARRRAGENAYADHLLGFVEFMQAVVSRVNPQVPLYLLVLPYDPLSSEERVRGSKLFRREQYQRGVQELARRSELVIQGLTRLNLGVRRLDDAELTAVLHRIYHPSIPNYSLPPSVRVKSLIVS